MYLFLEEPFLLGTQKKCPNSTHIKNIIIVNKRMLKRMNALTPAQGIILAKIAQNQPISPKSLASIKKLFDN